MLLDQVRYLGTYFLYSPCTNHCTNPCTCHSMKHCTYHCHLYIPTSALLTHSKIMVEVLDTIIVYGVVYMHTDCTVLQVEVEGSIMPKGLTVEAKANLNSKLLFVVFLKECLICYVWYRRNPQYGGGGLRQVHQVQGQLGRDREEEEEDSSDEGDDEDDDDNRLYIYLFSCSLVLHHCTVQHSHILLSSYSDGEVSMGSRGQGRPQG